jgi:hypothetical protein
MWRSAKWYQLAELRKINKLNNKQISARPIGTLAHWHISTLLNYGIYT